MDLHRIRAMRSTGFPSLKQHEHVMHHTSQVFLEFIHSLSFRWLRLGLL